MPIETYHVSSKGQLVIPEQTRKQLKIRKGTKLRAWVSNRQILLTPIRDPSPEDLQEIELFAGPFPRAETEEEIELVNQVIKEGRAQARAQAPRRH